MTYLDEHVLDRQTEFGERLASTFDVAAELLGAERTFEAALGGLVGWALKHASGPAIATTLLLLAAELAGHRGAGSATEH